MDVPFLGSRQVGVTLRAAVKLNLWWEVKPVERYFILGHCSKVLDTHKRAQPKHGKITRRVLSSVLSENTTNRNLARYVDVEYNIVSFISSRSSRGSGIPPLMGFFIIS